MRYPFFYFCVAGFRNFLGDAASGGSCDGLDLDRSGLVLDVSTKVWLLFAGLLVASHDAHLTTG